MKNMKALLEQAHKAGEANIKPFEEWYSDVIEKIPQKVIKYKCLGQVGATFGAFMYSYIINFNGNYYYSTQFTQEGFMYACEKWGEAGYKIVKEDTN